MLGGGDGGGGGAGLFLFFCSPFMLPAIAISRAVSLTEINSLQFVDGEAKGERRREGGREGGLN